MSALRATILTALDLEADGMWCATAPWLDEPIYHADWRDALRASVAKRPRI